MRFGESQHGSGGPLWKANRAFMQATARLRAEPTFLVIGAPQSGTTSFYSYLIRHPAVLPALVKEVRFFNLPDRYARGLSWYRSFFPLEATRRLTRRRLGAAAVGEASPDYLPQPQAPARVHRHYPAMRLIALLRNPVERAFSQYKNGLFYGLEPLSFREALEAEPERLEGELERMAGDELYYSRPYQRYGYVTRGRYADQLRRWLELFPREQLLVLTTEELERDPASAVTAAARFLGLPDWQPERLEFPRRNVRAPAELEPEIRARLDACFEAPNRQLYELVGRDLGWSPAPPD